MSLDLVGALKAPWSKDCGFARLFLGASCLLIPFLAFVPMGCVAEYLNKMLNGKNELGNIFKHGSKSFVIGGKMFLGYLLLMLPYFLLYLIFTLMLSEKHPFLYCGLTNILILVFSVLGFLLLLSFCTDFKILSYVDFDRLFKFVKESPSKAFIVCLLAFVIDIAYTVLMIIPGVVCAMFVGIFGAIGLLPISILLVLLTTVIMLVLVFAMIVSIMNILGQFGQESAYIQSIKQDLA